MKHGCEFEFFNSLKLVFIVIAVTLLISSIYASFFMHQAKNTNLLITLWLASAVSFMPIFYKDIEKINPKAIKPWINHLAFILSLLCITLINVSTFMFSGLWWLRLLLGVLIAVSFITLEYLNRKKEVTSNENN
ncbi:hypothetical protein JV173_00245 [Acholeplasma equirhinis]|uniref:hypothetical protein n=1 Tax=Acholeplasma equirhinis TaxID=555393 RepID=UPI00197AE7A7|nr:hypothetical protein [Acholeplasma equirhinis]MBN3489932.1 hypothetical protein [Acholeplasma equirhinis]